MDIEKLAERCMVAESCLPDAQYRTQLCKLHQEMLSELESARVDAERLTMVLVNVYGELESASAKGVIIATLYSPVISPSVITLFDYIDAAIDAARGGK